MSKRPRREYRRKYEEARSKRQPCEACHGARRFGKQLCGICFGSGTMTPGTTTIPIEGTNMVMRWTEGNMVPTFADGYGLEEET